MSALLAAPPATRPVACYARISKRRSGDGAGASLGRERQQEDTTAYAAEAFPGAPVVHYWDNMSAWNPDLERPDWSRMLAAIRAGEYGAVVAWHADRYTRQPLQLELLLDACKRSGTQLHTVSGGHVADPLALRIEGTLAARESDQKSERITRKIRQKAKQGTPHGGRRRWGYEADGMTVIESEAIAIREVVARLLHGESLRGLASWLNVQGYVGPSGATFTGPNLRTLVQRPALAGLRVHQGAVVGKAAWPAIITEADHEAIVHLLGDPKRRMSHTNARVYLLAGLAKCDECGADLRGRPGTKANPERRAYACLTGRHCYRATEEVDYVVTEHAVGLLQRLSDRGTLDLADDPTADELGALDASLAALEGRTDDLAGLLATGDLDPAAYAAATKRLAAERDALTERRADLLLAAARPNAVLEGMTGAMARQAWESADLGRQRAVLAELFASIRLKGAATRRAPFRDSDVVLVPRIG